MKNETNKVETGIFDSDQIVCGTKIKNEILQAIMKSVKSIHVYHGAAGSGKTTKAVEVFGENFITSISDVAKYKTVVVISGAMRCKGNEYSKRVQELFNRADSITAIIPSNFQIIRQRYTRIASGGNDTRSIKQIKATRYAPLNDYRLYAELRKQGKKVLINS